MQLCSSFSVLFIQIVIYVHIRRCSCSTLRIFLHMHFTITVNSLQLTQLPLAHLHSSHIASGHTLTVQHPCRDGGSEGKYTCQRDSSSVQCCEQCYSLPCYVDEILIQCHLVVWDKFTDRVMGEFTDVWTFTTQYCIIVMSQCLGNVSGDFFVSTYGIRSLSSYVRGRECVAKLVHRVQLLYLVVSSALRTLAIGRSEKRAARLC